MTKNPIAHMINMLIHILLYVRSNGVALDLLHLATGQGISHFVAGHHGLSSVPIKLTNTNFQSMHTILGVL